jgi:subtilisin family serine protease
MTTYIIYLKTNRRITYKSVLQEFKKLPELANIHLIHETKSYRKIDSLKLQSDEITIDSAKKENAIYLSNLKCCILKLSKNSRNRLKKSSIVSKIIKSKKIPIEKLPVGKVLNLDTQNQKVNNWGIEFLNVHKQPLLGDSIKIAILDSGIDLHHADFENRIQPENTKNFVNPNENVNDFNGHGTHVAGIIAGMRKDTKERYGVAPNATLIIGKVLNNNGSTISPKTILRAIEWAIEKGANIINMSFGSEGYGSNPFKSNFHELAQRAINKGVFLVAAVGNKSDRTAKNPLVSEKDGVLTKIDFPANVPQIIAVSGINQNKEIHFRANSAISSNTEIEFVDPGFEINSSYKNNTYASDTGTSMATAFVSGMIALVLQKNRNKQKVKKQSLKEYDMLRIELRNMAQNIPNISKSDQGNGILKFIGN